MGWIKQPTTQFDGSKFVHRVTTTQVVEDPGTHEWVTLAKRNGQPILGSDGKPFKIARPGHKNGHRFTVHSTRQAALKSKSQ